MDTGINAILIRLSKMEKDMETWQKEKEEWEKDRTKWEEEKIAMQAQLETMKVTALKDGPRQMGDVSQCPSLHERCKSPSKSEACIEEHTVSFADVQKTLHSVVVKHKARLVRLNVTTKTIAQFVFHRWGNAQRKGQEHRRLGTSKKCGCPFMVSLIFSRDGMEKATIRILGGCQSHVLGLYHLLVDFMVKKRYMEDLFDIGTCRHLARLSVSKEAVHINMASSNEQVTYKFFMIPKEIQMLSSNLRIKGNDLSALSCLGYISYNAMGLGLHVPGFILTEIYSLLQEVVDTAREMAMENTQEDIAMQNPQEGMCYILEAPDEPPNDMAVSCSLSLHILNQCIEDFRSVLDGIGERIPSCDEVQLNSLIEQGAGKQKGTTSEVVRSPKPRVWPIAKKKVVPPTEKKKAEKKQGLGKGKEKAVFVGSQKPYENLLAQKTQDAEMQKETAGSSEGPCMEKKKAKKKPDFEKPKVTAMSSEAVGSQITHENFAVEKMQKEKIPSLIELSRMLLQEDHATELPKPKVDGTGDEKAKQQQAKRAKGKGSLVKPMEKVQVPKEVKKPKRKDASAAPNLIKASEQPMKRKLPL
ncbi:hypothetical protein L7F22_054632 [Adiantum nelumboides]|nr:hypothetical protein [Adiantum nelumboides]